MNKNYFAPGANYYDHHKEMTVNVQAGTNVNVPELVRSFMAEDTEPIQEEQIQKEPQPAPKSPKDIWGIPQKGKYNQVREYIKDRKKGDPEFKEYCMRHSLREICSYLTDEFGWDVDEHSLGANLNRNRYS